MANEDRLVSKRRYLSLATRAGNAETPGTILLGLVPAALGSEVRTVELPADQWQTLADQLEAAAEALRKHALVAAAKPGA